MVDAASLTVECVVGLIIIPAVIMVLKKRPWKYILLILVILGVVCVSLIKVLLKAL